MEQFIQYAPVIVVVLVFLVQQRLVVTPEQLEKKHREILEDSERKFATLQMVNDLKGQFGKIEEKINEIYNLLIKG